MSNEIDPNRKVRVALDNEGFLWMAGDPALMSKESDKEFMKFIKEGYTVKTISFSEYKELKWKP